MGWEIAFFEAYEAMKELSVHFRTNLGGTPIPVIPTLSLYKILLKRYLSGSILLPYPRPHAPTAILKP